MAAAGVIGHQVGDDADAAVARFVSQPIECRQVAEERIHVAVVGYVVAPVIAGRGIERGDPDEVHTEVAEVAQFRSDALEVSDAVVVGVGE